jgi:uncharacterized membrane protein
MEESNRAHDRFLRYGSNSDRLQFFRDAVFVIAVTLLLIDNGPSVTQAALEPKLRNALSDEFPQFLAYGLSFAGIGASRAGHYRMFALLHRFDGTLVSMNLLLFLIVFVPFPTSLLSECGSTMPAVVLYAGKVAVIRLLQFALWAYAYRCGYLDKRVDAGMNRAAPQRNRWHFRKFIALKVKLLVFIYAYVAGNVLEGRRSSTKY